MGWATDPLIKSQLLSSVRMFAAISSVTVGRCIDEPNIEGGHVFGKPTV